MSRPRDPELERQRRAQIMNTVYLCLVEGSHSSLTLSRVASLAGVSKGMVTYYFESKDRLVADTIDHFLEREERSLLDIAREEGSFRERLERLIAIAIPSRDEVSMQVRFQTEVLSFAKERPEVFAAVRRSYVRFREACRAMIDVGLEEGYVTAPDPGRLYLLLHALVDGISFQLALDDSLDIDAVRAQVLELAERLLAPETSC